MAGKKIEKRLRFDEALNNKTVFDETCIVHQSFALIADKWTLLIVMALMQGTKRNSDLQKLVAGISPKMLAQTLKTLLSYGMISRKVYPEVPPHVEYSLTEFGSSLSEPIASLFDWSLDWEKKLRAVYKENTSSNKKVNAQLGKLADTETVSLR
jgi:DNA-binding HxlR family transcriptional regulator